MKRGKKMKIKWRVIVAVILLVLILIMGVQVYHKLEGWSYLDSTYFLVITATTIGYGDITPQTNFGKIITIFYSFVGIAIAFYFVSLISHSIFEKKLNSRLGHLKEKQKKLKEKKKNKNK